ncbi:hypothetical protein HYV86_07905 [Candidatus Woesearchaeota archaeon]|nr:hypothetical protein [Candidatus Woesearchaeota archaeon]
MPRFPLPKDSLVNIFPDYSPIKVKYKDIFNIKEFYMALHHWLNENGWKDIEKDGDHWESYYGERIGQGGEREIWIWWRMRKNPPDTPSGKDAEGKDWSAHVYYLDLDFHFLNIQNTEVVREGKKLPAHKGEVEMIIRAYVHEQYKDAFDKSSILKEIKGLFSHRWYSNTSTIRQKQLYQETYSLQNFIKQWFKLKRYMPYEEARTFWSSRAWPSHIKEEQKE